MGLWMATVSTPSLMWIFMGGPVVLATASAKKIGAFFERVSWTYRNKNREIFFHFGKAPCLSFQMPYWSTLCHVYFWNGNRLKIFVGNPKVQFWQLNFLRCFTVLSIVQK